MDALNIDVQTGSALLAGLAYTALAVHFLLTGMRKGSGTRTSFLFGCALTASAAWGWISAAEPYTYAIPAEFVGIADMARYGCWFAFLLNLLAEGRPKAIALLGPVSAALILVGLLASGAPMLGIPISQVWGRWALYVGLTLPVCGLILVEQLFRNVADTSRWSAKPLCLGLAVVFVFDLYLYSQATLFGRVDEDGVSIRGAIDALAVPLFYLSSRRHGDWLARLQVSRTAVFHSAALALAGAYLLVVAAVGYYIRYFGGSWGPALQLIALIVALTLLVGLALSGTMRARLRVLVGKHFFSYRYDYREEWLRLTAMLSAKSSPAQMGTLVIRGLADMVESPAGALWIRGPEQADFVQTARWNLPEIKEREPVDSEFSRFLRRKGWIVELPQLRADPAHYDGLVAPAWSATGPFWLVIPLVAAEEMIGFVALTDARTRIEIDWEVTDLLKTASRQAAGFLAQMYATEALLEARKFDAFNRMSAFVVHDLKNIVTQLSLMLKNASRLRDNPEFQQDMLATVESSLEKMKQLMLQLREGEAPRGGQSGVELLPIVRRIEAMAAERARTVELQVIDPVVTRGHEQKIERVLGHVVQNALDATLPADRVWLKLSRHSGWAQVEVGDTGKGMTQDYVQNRLFKPFQTTKQTGMGIGSFESFQYVRELGGNISVDSEPGRGTIMTISLPLFEPHQASALQMSGAK